MRVDEAGDDGAALGVVGGVGGGAFACGPTQTIRSPSTTTAAFSMSPSGLSPWAGSLVTREPMLVMTVVVMVPLRGWKILKRRRAVVSARPAFEDIREEAG